MSKRKKNNNDNNGEGGSKDSDLFDMMFSYLAHLGDASSSYLEQAISKLEEYRKEALAREEEEKEKKRRAEEKRQKKEAEEREAKQKEAERQREAKRAEEAHVKEVTSMELPLDWENAFATDERTAGVYADNPSDGLILSLSNLGKVDIEYISAICGMDYKSVILALKGSIYQNPQKWEECFYKGWETADEYLSGNLIRKWDIALEANRRFKGYFDDNIEAIKSVLPESVSPNDIYITLGSPWVPADIIDDFIEHLFGVKTTYKFDENCNWKPVSFREIYPVLHDEMTGSWEIKEKGRYGCTVATVQTWGTIRVPALYLIEKALNMQIISVMDEVANPMNASGISKVVNQPETIAAIEKQQKLIKHFQQWVWKDEDRKNRLITIFEERYSCVRHREFNGSYLTFPTMDKSVTLYPYQKNAVARILYSPNTLLAHDVGSGKTYVMVAAGMELKRMGLSRKNLYVVPNNIVSQWQTIYKTMYPQANILCVSPKDFTPAKRKKVLERIRDEKFDGVIMAYSCFEMIPLSKQCYIDSLMELQDKITELLKDRKNATTRLSKKLEKVKKTIAEVSLEKVKPDVIFFDELGITRLFVDEAHNYKNLPIETKTSRTLGIANNDSKRCKDMLDKVRYVQKENGGGGVVLATGTPITNSVTDAYIMQTYLQSGQLAMIGLQSFDSWVGMFAEQRTEFEVDIDTTKFRLATRFSQFHNLTELTTLLSFIADFHIMEKADGLPDFNGYTDSVVPKTYEFDKYLKSISDRADAVRGGLVDRKTDNMLKITTDGRKAALDLRLVDPVATFTYSSKIARCAENVYEIYLHTSYERSTQLVFCDTSVPKKDFNLYDELKNILVYRGVSPDEIAFIHDYEAEKERAELFERVRRGDVRILMGSTFKLGLGVNVQDKLIAVHHLDVPWRPADMTQREGRILRQGNTNKEVKIFRYIMEGSFDAYSWQLLETKQRFICNLLSGSLQERSSSDIEDTVLSYAEVKALAVGNPLIKERVETANELSRYYTLQRKIVESRLNMEKELEAIPKRIEEQRQKIDCCREDISYYAGVHREYSKEERAEVRDKLFDAVCGNVLEINETYLMNYDGFDIILPANMLPEKRFVYVVHSGKYYCEMGDSKNGMLLRVDNLLAELEKRLKTLEEILGDIVERQDAIKAELAKNENYTDKIESLKRKLERIDKKLGVI